jgi:hypothetical protein
MSTQSIVLVRSFLVISFLLSAAPGCVPALPGCPAGFVLEGSRCVQRLAADAGMPPGDAGPTLGAPDAGPPVDACAWRTWHLDADGDGFGDPATTIGACVQPTGTVSDATDCDDMRAATHPGATEQCNGLDDDCSGGVDEGMRHTYYADCDGDGFATATGETMTACPPPALSPACVGLGAARQWTETEPAATTTDCDDANAALRPDNRYWPDCDGDGYAAPGAAVTVACVRPPVAPASCGSSIGATWTATEPTASSSDCGDRSRLAYPHSTVISVSSFVANDGTASWDYDCDGASTPRYPNGHANATGWCHRDITTGACVPAASAWQELVPACGERGTLWTCTDSGGRCVGAPWMAADQVCH